MPFMGSHAIKTVFKILISLVWLVNGLFCKVMNLVPRHQLIVARILGEEHANLITRTIGILEILMFFWVLTGFKSRVCSIIQIIIVLTMNLIEFFVVPDLLLFGKLNLPVAFTFTGIVVIYEFILRPAQKPV